MTVGETVDNLLGCLFQAVDQAVGAVGTVCRWLVQQERVEDARAILEVIGDDVDEVRVVHDVLNQSSRR